MNISLVSATAWIVGSSFFVTGIGYNGIYAYLKYRHARRISPNYYLSRIIQTGPQREALNTTYLAELIDISADYPTPIGRFDPSLAARLLLQSPVINEATVNVIEPNTIHIDYTVRQPLAWLLDFSNTAIDENGYPFPVNPFFSPKNLPEIYLSIDRIAWNQPIEGRSLELAFTILKLLSDMEFTVKRVDVSQAFAETLGRREIILILADRGYSHFLRLSTKDYMQELGNYLEIRENLASKSHVIDLRLPQLGFIQELSKEG
jgi:cell division septal protein FtsQ